MRTETNNKNHIAEKLVSGEYNVCVYVCVTATEWEKSTQYLIYTFICMGESVYL